MDLTRPQVSAAIEDLGWRVLLTTLAASVAVPSLARGLEVAADLVAAAGAGTGSLRVDARATRVEVVIETRSRRTRFCDDDVDLARTLSVRIAELGLAVAPAEGVDAAPRPVQTMEIAIDALDIRSIRPFWRAVLAYGDEPGGEGPEDAIVDPARQGPTIWFQQMDAPRPQRNRIHVDVVVAHDEAQRRLAAAIAAGGRLVGDDEAPAFWVLADAEGNEICICTWQARD